MRKSEIPSLAGEDGYAMSNLSESAPAETPVGEFSKSVAQRRCVGCGRITMQARCPDCGQMLPLINKVPQPHAQAAGTLRLSSTL